LLRTFELRLRPNAEQRRNLSSVLSISCELYNAALQERRDAWKICRKRIGYEEQTRQITELRKCDPETASLAVDIAREPLRRVDRAFQAFFRRCKHGEKPGYPRFRSKLRYNSFATSQFQIREGSLAIAKLGSIRFKAHREIAGTPRHLMVKRHGSKWTACVVCDIGEAPAKQAIRTAVGIDLGLIDFVTLSDGSSVPVLSSSTNTPRQSHGRKRTWRARSGDRGTVCGRKSK
jgi:putative transposase